MSFDINVLVVDQENPVEIPFETDIEVINEMQKELRYAGIWKFMTNTKGIWYELGLEENGWFNSLSLVDADFESNSLRDCFYWVDNEDIKSNLVPLIIFEKYKKDFQKIIKYLINNSPIKTAKFLARYQGGEHEIVCGTLSFNRFVQLLDEGQILFNVCYIISD